MPIIIETKQEFAGRHGNEAVFIRDRFLFKDGAQWFERSDLRGGVEPPSDEYTLLLLKREYLATRLAAEEGAWTKFRNECAEQAGFRRRYGHRVPGPPPDAPAQLRAGKQRIAKLRAALRGINAKLAQRPETEVERVRQEHEAELDRRAAELEAEIKSIEI